MIPRVLRLAVLLSGTGRTLAHLAAEIRAGRLDARIAGVLSTRADAYGLVRACRLGLRRRTVSPRDFPARRAFWEAVSTALDRWRPDLVVMAGWTSYWRIPRRWAGRVVNIHPSLLPAFGGKGCYGDRVHAQVLASRARITGCTVHAVDNRYDHGRVLAQARVPVRRGDTVRALAARVFVAERRLYPAVLRRIASGGIGLPIKPIRPQRKVPRRPRATSPSA